MSDNQTPTVQETNGKVIIKTIPEVDQDINELDILISAAEAKVRDQGIDCSVAIAELTARRYQQLKEKFVNLTAADKVFMARHPKRPYTLDYVRQMFDGYRELHGDRLRFDDPAMIGGFGTLGEYEVIFVGQQKGRLTAKDRVYRNFGSARPEGYRKALRLMHLAEKFHRPVICFLDTPAAACDLDAEQNGISWAIADNMTAMFGLRTPIVAVNIGEGGSGGAIGIGVADRILMQENAIYSVIPPEGCASILWRDPSKVKEAALALKPTAETALQLGVIDEIILEPPGGAHRDGALAAQTVKEAILRHLDEITQISTDKLLEQRYTRFRNLGIFNEG
jgi:acetyl-CoA carboxylase carboxyl transferase subunit alpha